MNNRTAIITGGNKGIGLNITEAFIKSNYKVVVGARNDTGLEKRFPGKTRFLKMDVKNEQDHFRLVKLSMDWTGSLDVYVNNAGFSEWRPIEKIDEFFFSSNDRNKFVRNFLGMQGSSGSYAKWRSNYQYFQYCG